MASTPHSPSLLASSSLLTSLPPHPLHTPTALRCYLCQDNIRSLTHTSGLFLWVSLNRYICCVFEPCLNCLSVSVEQILSTVARLIEILYSSRRKCECWCEAAFYSSVFLNPLVTTPNLGYRYFLKGQKPRFKFGHFKASHLSLLICNQISQPQSTSQISLEPDVSSQMQRHVPSEMPSCVLIGIVLLLSELRNAELWHV